MRFALIGFASSGCLVGLTVTTPAPVAVGEAPAFALCSQDGRTVDLATELAHGPVVLVFYRGFW